MAEVKLNYEDVSFGGVHGDLQQSSVLQWIKNGKHGPPVTLMNFRHLVYLISAIEIENGLSLD